MRDNVGVNDVPKNPVTRAAKMARLPIGLAGRTAIGMGKRIGGGRPRWSRRKYSSARPTRSSGS